MVQATEGHMFKLEGLHGGAFSSNAVLQVGDEVVDAQWFTA